MTRTGSYLLQHRSLNRLYKVRIGLKQYTSLHLTRSSESRKWHARLGHVNLETMRAMIQRELVLGVPSINIKKEVCGSCLKGKQARQVFPQATQYRANKKLQLLHGDLCGPKLQVLKVVRDISSLSLMTIQGICGLSCLRRKVKPSRNLRG